MNITDPSIQKRGPGTVTLNPHTHEDMLHVYNLLAEGDLLTKTIKTTQNELVLFEMWICRISYHFEESTIDIAGRKVQRKSWTEGEESIPEDTGKGDPTRIRLGLNQKFTLGKFYWDTVAIQRLKIASRKSHADVAAVIMQEGLAHLCVFTKFVTHVVAKIEYNKIPSKRMGASKHEQGLYKFYDLVQESMLKHINIDSAKCILLASPGFVNDHFFQYMMQKVANKSGKDMKKNVLLQNKNKFLLAHSSSGFEHSLNEVLMCKDPIINRTLANTNAISETRAVEEFYDMLHADANKAYYGSKHVDYAFSLNAVRKLIISDALFLTPDRQKYVELAERVQMEGNELCILSSFHTSGEQLKEFADIAVILKFPIPEPEDNSEDEQ